MSSVSATVGRAFHGPYPLGSVWTLSRLMNVFLIVWRTLGKWMPAELFLHPSVQLVTTSFQLDEICWKFRHPLEKLSDDMKKCISLYISASFSLVLCLTKRVEVNFKISFIICGLQQLGLYVWWSWVFFKIIKFIYKQIKQVVLWLINAIKQ